MSRRPRRADLEVSGVFDIECQDWSRFVAGGLLLSDRGRTYLEHDHRTEDDLVDAILRVRGTLWAHHGGRYDGLWLLDHLRRRRIPAKISGGAGRATLIDLRPGLPLRIRDSAGLVPRSLGDFAALAGRRKADLSFPCICRARRSCGGYCSIRRDLRPDLRSRLLAYMREDCEALLAALEALRGLAEACDLDLGGTLGSSAWKTAKRWLNLEPAAWEWREYRFARAGYFGGRSQVFKRSSAAGWRYDIHAAYPAALCATDLPLGAPDWIEDPSAAGRAYRRGLEGIYQASAEVPPSFAPPLPIRIRDRVGYPTGILAATWTGIELRAAEARGAKILGIRRALVYPARGRILEPFARRLVELRDLEGARTPKGAFLKDFANAITGKIAQRPDLEELTLSDDPPVACPADGLCFGVLCGSICCAHACSRRCKRWDPIDPRGSLWSRTVYRIPACGQIHWAAYLTAAQRIELGTEIEADHQAGASSCYTDTDSLFTERERTRNVGEGIGQWRPEGRFSGFEAIAPKTYRYKDEETGITHARAKGFPDAAIVFELLKSRELVADARGVESLKIAAARGGSLFVRRIRLMRQRGRGAWIGDRQLGADRTYTWPADVRELREEWDPKRPSPTPGSVADLPGAGGDEF